VILKIARGVNSLRWSIFLEKGFMVAGDEAFSIYSCRKAKFRFSPHRRMEFTPCPLRGSAYVGVVEAGDWSPVHALSFKFNELPSTYNGEVSCPLLSTKIEAPSLALADGLLERQGDQMQRNSD